jgi:CDP-glucose 4,6-dehydratase
LAQALGDRDATVAEAYNFGPATVDAWPVWRVLKAAEAAWGAPLQTLSPPIDVHRPESTALRLDASMAVRDLNWRNRLGTAEAIEWTVNWEQALRRGASAATITAQQIDRLMAHKETTHVA